MNQDNFTTDIRLKLSPKAPAIPCVLSPAVHGPAFLTIYYNQGADYVQLLGRPADLAAALRRLAEMIEPASVKARHEKVVKNELAEMPAVLDDPATAWPWLVKRFPWLFDGIETAKEPYASYLKPYQVTQPAPDQLEALRGRVISQADVAEFLFGDRTKTGGSYRRRILAVLDQLATTTPTEAKKDDPEAKKAA